MFLWTCRLSREPALLQWLQFVREVGGRTWFEKVTLQVLDALKGLLKTV